MLTNDQLRTFALLEKSLSRQASNRDDVNTTLLILATKQEDRIQALERQLEHQRRYREGFIAFFNTTGVSA